MRKKLSELLREYGAHCGLSDELPVDAVVDAIERLVKSLPRERRSGNIERRIHERT